MSTGLINTINYCIHMFQKTQISNFTQDVNMCNMLGEFCIILSDHADGI